MFHPIFWAFWEKKEGKATYQVSSRSSANWGYCKLKWTINANQIDCSHHCAIPAPNHGLYHFEWHSLFKTKRVSFTQERVLSLWTEFITKALKGKRPQKGTRHYKIIQRVNVSQRAIAGMTCGWPHKRSSSPPSPLHFKNITGTLQFNTTQLSAFCFCVTRTTGNPVYAHGASSWP